MKKLLMFMMVLMVAVTGCSKAEDSSKGKLETIKANKVIKIGTNSGYPPYEFYINKDGKKELVGFEVDLANELAKELGVEVEWVDMDFDGLIPALLSNKIDVIMAGISPTPERKEKVAFTDLYVESKSVFMTKNENKDTYTSLDKVVPGTKIVVQLGTLQEKEVKKMEGVEVISLAGINDMLTYLKEGRADLLAISETSAGSIVAKNEGLMVYDYNIVEEENTDGTAICLNKGDEEFYEYLNNFIKKNKESGLIEELFAKNQKLAAEYE